MKELLSHLSEQSWKNALENHFKSPSFRKLAAFVARERSAHTIYPPPSQTFTALNLCPLDSIKVVIVGQDPYHGPGQAHGLCFSVLPGQQVPPSLKNIYKELFQDEKIDFPKVPQHGHLLPWAKQGVLMLNTVLTVRKSQANSHKKMGWETVTDEILRALDRYCQETDKGIVFLLWGKPATAKTETLMQQNKKKLHTFICTSHPSPLGATKTDKPFLGSKCFSRCNDALIEKGYTPIDWKL